MTPVMHNSLDLKIRLFHIKEMYEICILWKYAFSKISLKVCKKFFKNKIQQLGLWNKSFLVGRWKIYCFPLKSFSQWIILSQIQEKQHAIYTKWSFSESLSLSTESQSGSIFPDHCLWLSLLINFRRTCGTDEG